MALAGYVTGVLPPHTILPPTGPRGVLPAQPIDGPGIPPPYNKAGGNPFWPQVPIGGGYLSGLRRRVESLDVVRGVDRLLGKTTFIQQGKRQAQSSKNLGLFSTQQALGRLTGRLPSAALGRAVDITG